MHILGTCSDSPTHIDLLDFILMGGTATAFGVYLKQSWKNFKIMVNGQFRKETKKGNKQNLQDDYNKRVFELNLKTVEYAKNFIAPKGHIVDNQIEYDLNDDDKAVLLGYKNSNNETLKKEFPLIFEVMEDLKFFEDKIDTKLFN